VTEVDPHPERFLRPAEPNLHTSGWDGCLSDAEQSTASGQRVRRGKSLPVSLSLFPLILPTPQHAPNRTMNQKSRPPDPPWKKPSPSLTALAPHVLLLIYLSHQARPCPFYSQGRCLFSDSCSFLHEVKIKVPKSSIHVPSSSQTGKADDHSPEPIDSMPWSESPVSPNRSPRMSSLLLALKGVISDNDLEIETEEGIQSAIEIPSRFVHLEGPEDPLDTGSEDATIQIPHTQSSSEVTYDLPLPTEVSEDPPIPPAPLHHPPETAAIGVDASIDSIHPRPPSPTARGSHLFSPHASDKPSRDDSIDSGYAELRASTPPPLTLSSPLSRWRHSTLNLLSSPFGSPTTRAFPSARSRLNTLVSPRFDSFPSSVSERAPSPTERVAEMVDATRRHSDDAKSRSSTSIASFSDSEKGPSPTRDDPFTTSSPSPSSLDSPGAYPALPPGSPPPHEDSEETKPPVIREVALSRTRASSILTVVPRSEATESPPPLPESLPWVADVGDDAVTSMYGLYHSSSSDHVWSPPSPMQNYSRPSSSASFYPPRPSSAAVESLSTKSPFNDNCSTGSSLVPSTSSSALSIRTDLGPPSSTVPFGFRDQKRHGSRQASTVFRRPQPLTPSPPHSALEFQQPLSSGPRSLKPLRLSMILNSGRSSASPMNEVPPSTSPSPSVQSDFSISNSRLLSSARSSIIPEHVRNTSSSNDLSPLLLGTPSGSHQHHLPNFGPLSNITVPSPTPSQISMSSSVIQRQYNPLIPNREFRNSVHLHSRASSTLSEPFYVVREEEEDLWNNRVESNLRVDHAEIIRRPFSTSGSPHLENTEEESAQPQSVFTESPVSTAAPILEEMIDAHAANPSRSSSLLSRSPAVLPTRRLRTATFSPRAQNERSTPHLCSASVFTKDPVPSTITNSSRPTLTHTRRQPSHAIATPRPTLMFAIASDDVSQVQQVLDNGEANPNDQVGPQSALKFALTNDQLTNRLEIVKTLLAYGADPAGLRDSSSGGQEHSRRSSVVISGSSPAHVGHSLNASEIGGQKEVDPAFEAMKSQMDPATRYFINRADAPKNRCTSALIHRSFFRPLTRMRYDIIGQDCAFEQLFRCLSIQSQNLSVSPLVVMLCGPSGHGKSLFARKFGSLLGVPTHTVNMTTLRSTHDLWQSYSMSPYEEPSTLTLAEFLTDNEGKRCVVVLDVRDFLDPSSRRKRLTAVSSRKSTRLSTKRPSSPFSCLGNLENARLQPVSDMSMPGASSGSPLRTRDTSSSLTTKRKERIRTHPWTGRNTWS